MTISELCYLPGDPRRHGCLAKTGITLGQGDLTLIQSSGKLWPHSLIGKCVCQRLTCRNWTGTGKQSCLSLHSYWPAQNGVDCGLDTVANILQMAKNGLQYDRDCQPICSPNKCGHFIHHLILKGILLAIWDSYQFWQTHPLQSWWNATEPDSSILLAMEAGLHGATHQELWQVDKPPQPSEDFKSSEISSISRYII